jgi:predicted porin
MQTNTSFTVRANNMLSVNTDTFAGFQGNAMYVYSGTNTNSVTTGSQGYSGGATTHTAWGLGVNYTWQKLLVTANYQNFTDKNPYSISGTNYNSGAPVMNGWGATSAQGTNAKDNQQYYAATYDFGILKAYANWISRKASDTANSSYYQKRQAEQIGVRSFVTPTVEAWASAGVGTFTPYGNNQSSAHFNAWQLGSNYWLSKRTNLYAIYGQFAQSNAQYSVTTAGGVTTTGNYAANQNSYAIGARHTF